MNSPKPTRIPFTRYAAVVLVLVIVLGSGFSLMRIWEKNQHEFPEWTPEDPVVHYKGREYELKTNVDTFLVLGLDTFEEASGENSYVNDRQADFLMLFVLDNEEKQYTAIQINRDTMAPVDVLGVAGSRIDTVEKQIALAHTYGDGRQVSCLNTAKAVSGLLMGVKVRHYLSVTMDAVPLLSDLVGGVEVEVLNEFTGIDDTLVKGERVTLTGQQALTYVRARKGLEDSSNNDRMIRQQQFLAALQDRMTACMAEDDGFIAGATVQMADYMVSGESVQDLEELVRRVNGYTFTGIRHIEGESKPGERFMEFHPDTEAVEALVIDVFYRLREAPTDPQ